MKREWLPIGGLLLLSLGWAVGWVRGDLFPGAAASGPKLNGLQSQAALLGIFALLAAVVAAIGKKRWPEGKIAGKAVLVGVGLFVIPAVLTAALGEWIDHTTRVALFSLAPLFAVVFEPHLSSESKREVRGAFPAAMVAVAGTFLVFPFELPSSYAAAGALLAVVVSAASVAAANCAGVDIVQTRDICPLTTGSMSAGSASILVAIAGLTHVGGNVSSSALSAWAIVDLSALALLFWLMGHVGAVQMTTRFLIAPLIANLISLAKLRPHVEVQSWIGLVLIAAGAGWLLFAQEDASTSAISMANGRN